MPLPRGKIKIAPGESRQLSTTIKYLEQDEEKWKPDFRRNQVDADRVDLSAYPALIIGIDHVYKDIRYIRCLNHEFGLIQSKLIVI